MKNRPQLPLSVRTSIPALVLAVAVGASPEPATPAAPEAEGRSVAPPSAAAHWAYEGEAGPSSWGELSPEFVACAEGRAQSPIDITHTVPATLPELTTTFRKAELKIAHGENPSGVVNTGHTIQVSYAQGDSLTLGAESFELAQFHFHAPSEHTLAGRHAPMEMHLVHRSAAGNLAVIAVLVEQGAHSAAFEAIWSKLPRTSVESHDEHGEVQVDDLLPKSRTTYRYQGSLTTPPCSEGVEWFVMTTPIQASEEQIGAFTAILGKSNRPVQPLHGRKVATDSVAEQ